MTYNEFKEEFMDKLAEKAQSSDQIGEYKLYEDGATSENPTDSIFIRETNIKYNKTESDVLIGDFLNIIHTDDCSQSRFDIKYLYDSFKSDGWDFVWKIVDDNLNYAESIDMNNIMEIISDYEAIKDRLILRAINFTDNKYALKDFVYKQIGDMALVLYLYISETKEYGLSTTKVHKVTFESWGKDMDEVMETALVNSNIRSVPRMYNTPKESANPDYKTGAYMAIGSKCKLAYGILSSTFTTYPYLNGAISFWYPGVKEKIAEMAGGDYYVAFTGIHDFHVHPVGSTSARDVLGNVKHMNKINGKNETLSRKVYRYRADTKELVQLEL